MAAAPILALQVGRQITLVAVVPMAVLALLADLLRHRNRAFEAWIQSIFGFMMRPSERAGDSMVINGATWVLVSFAALILLFPFEIATQAMFVFILADAFAALVGQRFGSHPWPRSQRTIEGSTAFILVGTAAAALFPGSELLPSVCAVLAGAIVEIPPRPLNDNVRVPFAIAAVLFLIKLFT